MRKSGVQRDPWRDIYISSLDISKACLFSGLVFNNVTILLPTWGSRLVLSALLPTSANAAGSADKN